MIANKTLCTLCNAPLQQISPVLSTFCKDCLEIRTSAFEWTGICTEPSVIDTNLYLSKADFAQDKSKLDFYGIKSVLTVADIPPAFPAHYRYKVIKVSDTPSENLKKHFSEMVDFIEESLSKGEPVLVHCGAGQSRSPTAIMAYLMKSKGWNLHQAYVHVLRIRPFIYPNEAFLNQLKEYFYSK